MPTYKTPGVYVEEVSTLPPSVAEVSTAIPAFLGYTEKGPELARVDTMLEFESLFGGPKPSAFTVETETDSSTGLKQVSAVRGDAENSRFLLYYALSHYFKNGGGSCYVLSVGNYEGPLSKADFETGLKLLEKEDEPTLILLTDAVNLASADYYALCQASLSQSAKLGDRFAILDVLDGDGKVAEFRDNVGTNDLKYGAAYTPYLRTTLSYRYGEDLVSVQSGDQTDTLASLEATDTHIYNQVKVALSAERVTLPPSPAMAGIYARTDRDRGVWKAPANVSVASVIGPVSKINHAEQENLNVDPTAGKSINAIRPFTGKGTLVWGARTLAGNDNEWRYVPVRRLFNMIEESIQKSTAFAVFEPNDASTWLKVKAMAESYLYGLWEQGALAGPEPEAAYFVNVGLGKTMTAQDVLEGRMIVEIGVAAVRPAEFIILRFTHKLQEA